MCDSNSIYMKVTHPGDILEFIKLYILLPACEELQVRGHLSVRDMGGHMQVRKYLVPGVGCLSSKLRMNLAMRMTTWGCAHLSSTQMENESEKRVIPKDRTILMKGWRFS